MKKYFPVVVLLLLMVSAVGQPKPKPKPKEKPPTQKELADMMKEMQAEIDNISPEDKKMMDSLGIKMPDVKSIQKNVSGISDAQLKKAFEDESRIVPLKDAGRINIALTVKVSNAEMGAYINKTHQDVLAKLSASAKTTGAELLHEIVKMNASVSNTAVGLWIDGKPTLALIPDGRGL